MPVKINPSAESTKKAPAAAHKQPSPKVTNKDRLKLLLPFFIASFALLIPVFVSMSRLKLPPELFNPALYNRISTMWFADLPHVPVANGYEPSMKKWYGLGASADEKAAFDDLCKRTSLPALEAVAPEKYPLPATDGTYQDELNHASTVARPFIEHINSILDNEGSKNASMSALSILLLLDQMPRNIFRDQQGLIYNHYDRLSRSFLRHILRSPERLDRHSSVRDLATHRWFFYMPLMHSEHIEDHDTWKSLADEIREIAVEQKQEPVTAFLDNGLKFGKKHRDIVEQFGRYPYRNGVMNRNTTQAEKEWLENGGETFGA